ncbi:MAG: S41 family peptidase [Bacteroidetes bacterium]|nr:S41 family peptidase [Bacteroidota bacterium]
MTRTKKMWFSILGLVVGIVIGLRIEKLISGDSIYDQMEKFKTVLFLVQKNYVDEVQSPKLVESAIVGMLNDLDPHSVYIPAEQQKRVEEDFRGSFQGIGVEFDMVKDTITIISPISGGPSEALGILAGDKIVKIDGQNAVGLSREDVPKKLRGPKGTRVQVTVVRPQTADPLVFDITRDDIPLYTVDAAFVDENGTGYLTINRFAEPTYDEMMKNLDRMSNEGMKRLILDLRGNPGGYMEKAIRIVDEFVPGGRKIVYTKSSRSSEEENYMSEDGQRYEKLPLIVLINRGSASASEIVSGAIQDLDRGLIVGETSFGKGLVQRQFPLNDGSAFRLTIARYYTPSGRLIQRPYDKGKEAYYQMSNRQEDEEGDNVNHTHDVPDSTRPVFRTLGGRRVLGGGGITPDYVVKLDTLTTFGVDVIRKNLIWEYMEQYFDANASKLRSQYNGKFNEFSRNFQITDQMWNDFMALAKQKGANVDPKLVAADRHNVEVRLKARLARSLWGNNEFFRIALEDDKQYQKALTLFPEASKVAKLTMR